MINSQLIFLAGGGYADVYRWPQSDGRVLVVKFLRDPQDPDALRAFRREIRVLSSGVHPGLVTVLADFSHLPEPHYVMPFFEGGPLTNWAGALCHVALRAAATELAEPIAALHAHNIVHGDLKPDNIFLSREGALKVGDPLGNGSGCTITWGANRGGTQGYWAPEVAAGSPISKEGDVFSFGATLFHLVTGVVPEDGANLDPWRMNVAAPVYVRNIILASCRPHPAQRPTMQRILQVLRTNSPVVHPGRGTSDPITEALKAVAVVGGVLLGAVAIASTFDKR